MSSVRIAMVQTATLPTRDACVDQAVQQIRRAAASDAQVICLPELFHGPYPCQCEDQSMFDWAEPIEGDSVTAIRRVAAENSVVVVTPIFQRRGAGVYHNTAVVVDADGSVAGVYRKMHIPDDPLYREKFYFSPGDSEFKPIETRYGKLGVGICWDQWFPEVARLQTLAGAEVLLYPSAIGWTSGQRDVNGPAQYDAWVTSMRGHAIANGIHVAAANRHGTEDRIEFWGGSVVISPLGKVVQQAPHDADALLMHDCRQVDLDAVRTHWPFLRDRRPEHYSGLSQRWIDGC